MVLVPGTKPEHCMLCSLPFANCMVLIKFCNAMLYDVETATCLLAVPVSVVVCAAEL